MKMSKKWYVIAPFGILAILLFMTIGGEVVMHLWNWLLPPLAGLRPVTFWQALGILALSRILFGGWGSHGSQGRSRCRNEKRWGRITPEERDRIRQGMRAGEPAAGESRA